MKRSLTWCFKFHTQLFTSTDINKHQLFQVLSQILGMERGDALDLVNNRVQLPD